MELVVSLSVCSSCGCGLVGVWTRMRTSRRHTYTESAVTDQIWLGWIVAHALAHAVSPLRWDDARSFLFTPL